MTRLMARIAVSATLAVAGLATCADAYAGQNGWSGHSSLGRLNGFRNHSFSHGGYQKHYGHVQIGRGPSGRAHHAPAQPAPRVVVVRRPITAPAPATAEVKPSAVVPASPPSVPEIPAAPRQSEPPVNVDPQIDTLQE